MLSIFSGKSKLTIYYTKTTSLIHQQLSVCRFWKGDHFFPYFVHGTFSFETVRQNQLPNIMQYILYTVSMSFSLHKKYMPSTYAQIDDE